MTAAPPTRSLRRNPVLVATVVAVVLGIAGVAGAATGVFTSLVHPAGTSHTSRPGNDDLAHAAAVAASASSFSGTTAHATRQRGEPGSSTATVWYRWTPTASGEEQVLPQTGTGNTVHVFTGTAFPLHQVDGADSGGATQFAASAGTTYRLQIGAGAHPGAFSYRLLHTAATVPGNDAFAAAYSLNQAVNALLAKHVQRGTLAQASTVGATTEHGEPSAGGVHSVWFSWLPPSAASTVRVTVPSGLTARAFTGPGVTSLHPLGAAARSATLKAPAGTTVYLRVAGLPKPFTLAGALSAFPVSDTAAPRINCAAPHGWTRTGRVSCTATDPGSGLARKADAAFTLEPTLPVGATASDVATTSRTVCDRAGNCAQAGPYLHLRVDDTAPAVLCSPVPVNWVATQARVTCTATDAGSGLAHAADKSFTVTTHVSTTNATAPFATHPPVCDLVGNCAPLPALHVAKVDANRPSVHCGSAPPGWHDADVTIACTASDVGSGLASTAQAQFDLTTTVGDAGVNGDASTDTVRVCDKAGNCVSAGPVRHIKVDRRRPVVSCTPPSGWHAGTSETVRCTVSDTGSGLVGPSSFALPASIPAGTESDSAHTAARQVCDHAGNCSSAGPFTGLELDDAAPSITCEPMPPEWHTGAVSVTCTATDAGSQVRAPDSVFTLTANIANGTASSTVALPRRTVCDLAGNCARTPSRSGGRIDRVLPKAVCAGPRGVHYAEVVVTCTATDVGSGLADPSRHTFTLGTSVGAGNKDAKAMTNSLPLCDQAGNCIVAGPVGPFDVDRTHGAPGSAPHLTVPRIVHVVAGTGSTGTVPVPFTTPAATASGGLGVRVDCAPDQHAAFGAGRTLVVCTARDDADRTTSASFPVELVADPALAPSGAVVPGSDYPAAGHGFAPTSHVTIAFDSTDLGGTISDGSGAVSTSVTIPADAVPGPHVLSISGTAPDGQQSYVVVPLSVEGTAPGGHPPAARRGVPSQSPTGAPSPAGRSTTAAPAASAPGAAGGSSNRPAPAGGTGGALLVREVFGGGPQRIGVAELPRPAAARSSGASPLWLVGLGVVLAAGALAFALYRRRISARRAAGTGC